MPSLVIVMLVIGKQVLFSLNAHIRQVLASTSVSHGAQSLCVASGSLCEIVLCTAASGP